MNIFTTTKKLSLTTFGVSVIALGIATGGQQAQASTLFNTRTTFQNNLSTFITDGYENPNYFQGNLFNGTTLDIHTNASMSNVFGQTQYQTTTPYGVDGYNLIVDQGGNHTYCAGCNGSFLLDFTQTTLGSSLGVFGAGFDIVAGTEYFAHVIFGDDSTQDFSLAGQAFWGITSNKSIKGIHVGLAGGGSTTGGYIEIDNLTIGARAVPEPASLIGLLAFGTFGATSALKRKQQQNAMTKA